MSITAIKGRPREATHTIPSRHLNTLLKRVEFLERHSRKIKVPFDIRIEVLGERVVRFPPMGQRHYTVVADVTDLAVYGSVKRIKGYQFLAKIDHDPSGNIISRSPASDLQDYKIPVRFRTIGPNCDHCKLAIKRNQTYILLHEKSKKLIQVGSTCLADFLGVEDVSYVVNLFSMMAELDLLESSVELDVYSDGEEGFTAADVKALDLEEYMMNVIEIIRTDGWKGSAYAYESTGQTAWWLTISEKTTKKRLAIDSHRPAANLMISWAVDELKPSSDYEWNLQAALSRGIVTQKTANLVASLAPAYAREEARKRELASVTNEWWGDPGLQYILPLKLLRMHPIETIYGKSTIFSLQDPAGRFFKWFSGSSLDVSLGKPYWVAGTVKEHTEYRERKETVITRCVFYDDFPEKLKERTAADGQLFKTKKALRESGKQPYQSHPKLSKLFPR